MQITSFKLLVLTKKMKLVGIDIDPGMGGTVLEKMVIGTEDSA